MGGHNSAKALSPLETGENTHVEIFRGSLTLSLVRLRSKHPK
jgi:hypothetical protein